MSIIIQKAGILDTLQDTGRFGVASLGVNPNGSMDGYAHQLANALVGNAFNETVIESHFPAPVLYFSQSCWLAFSGADFHAQVNGAYLPINRPLRIPAGAVIRFSKKVKGERMYVAVQGGFEVPKVLGSTATNLKAGFGGWKGRALRHGDEIPFCKVLNDSTRELKIMPWFVKVDPASSLVLRVLHGPEWAWLLEESRQLVTKDTFALHSKSDRMAVRLSGKSLSFSHIAEMVSSAVVMGTVQLLPNGQLLVLMADHQTVGGYPRVMQIIKADLPKLAQWSAGTNFSFSIVKPQEAIAELIAMQQYLQQLATAIRLQGFA